MRGWGFAILLVLAPSHARADLGSCAQPQTTGSQPTASDCLAILSVAVGVRTCEPYADCVCAPKGTLPTTATDALVCLTAVVGGPATLDCPCEPTTTTTTVPTTTVTTTSVTSTTTSTTTTTELAGTTTTTLPPVDLDGDGWTSLDGDCCETPADGCAAPELVNPGAFDFAGDGFDDDCNGVPDDGDDVCDNALASDTSSAGDYAKALDLCSETTESPPASQRRYGLIAAALTLPDGNGAPAAQSRSIRPGFGGVAVQRGNSMIVLSTGNAAAPGQTNPGFSAFEPGTNVGTSSAAPADWLAANGGSVPAAPDCAAIADTTARDAVMLRLRVRVPTNARSFQLSANVLTSDFPEWVCGAYNDQFVVLLDSSAEGNPADKDLAVYRSAENDRYPVGVGLAVGDTGLFRQCRNGVIGCLTLESSITTCIGTTELADTGFDESAVGCQESDTVGGGTGWLSIRGNVLPGEVMELRIAVWDSGDSILDTVAILDDLRWSPDPVDAGTGL